MSEAWTVVKVGGSLYDLPDLRHRLTAWLDNCGSSKVLLFPGGGMTTQAIRELDRIHHLGEEASHWLAIQTLSVNAQLLQTLLPGTPIVAVIPDVPAASGCCILDPFPFLVGDEQRADHLPHDWQVTSDSLAARTAILFSARDLTLLKSVDWHGADWHEAARAGVVDAYFTEATRGMHPSQAIKVVNLRAAPFQAE